MQKLFQQLSGLGTAASKRLLQSPFLHKGPAGEDPSADRPRPASGARHHCQDECAPARGGVIERLYRASCAGVSRSHRARGYTAPCAPVWQESRTTSRCARWWGRFLEHSRVYWFANDGQPELFCASADWMERNLLRRIERPASRSSIPNWRCACMTSRSSITSPTTPRQVAARRRQLPSRGSGEDMPRPSWRCWLLYVMAAPERAVAAGARGVARPAGRG